MELELVSIKESSQGCRGNGRQKWWYCRIIQIGYDYHRAGVPQSWSRARRPLWSQTGGVWLGSSEGALAGSDETKLISCLNFHECDSKGCVIYCGLKPSVVEIIFVFSSLVCSVLSLLKAWRRCSSMKTGSLQCRNVMAHAESERQTFYWPCYSLVYLTEASWSGGEWRETLHSLCAVFLTKQICTFLLINLSVILYSTFSFSGRGAS